MDDWFFWISIGGGGIVGLYGSVCLGYWIFHRFFVMFPSKKMEKSPADFGLDCDEVFFDSGDGVKLQGWLLFQSQHRSEINDDQPVIVFFSGNAGTLDKFLPGLQRLVDSGLAIFAFSYRGFGKSSSRWPTEKGVYRDSLGAVDFLIDQRGFSSKQLVFFGQSLGCAMASYAAIHFAPAGLILEGGFPSLPETARRHVKVFPVHFLTTSRFDTRAHLKRVSCPCLIIHSQDDKAIPLEDATALFDAAPEPKRKILVRGPHAKALETDPVPVLKATHTLIGDLGLRS